MGITGVVGGGGGSGTSLLVDAITDGETTKAPTSNAVYDAITAPLAKVAHLTVTQAVDLDVIETRVNALDAAVVLKGAWDASAGTFPGGGTAQAGDSYIVSVGGTVNAVVFSVGDRIIAITDNASTGTFAANWFKADYTDLVSSVDGATGAVSLSGIYQPLDADLTALAALGGPLFVRKTADESVTSSTTYQNDDHLALAVVANAVYEMDLSIIYSAASAGDIKTSLAGPAGSVFGGLIDYVADTAINGALIVAAVSAAPLDGADYDVPGGGVGSSKLGQRWRGLVRTAATAGTLQFKWAQLTSSGTASTVHIDSFLLLKRIA
jgi:hypothetical protein